MTTGALTPPLALMEPRSARWLPAGVPRRGRTERKRPLGSHWILLLGLLMAGCDPFTWLGVVRTGDLVGDYVLQGSDSVALRMTRDVVAALRSKGYRASESGAPPRQPEDTLLQIRIVRLAATVYAAAFQMPKWQWSREPLWADFVYTSDTQSISASSRTKEPNADEAFYRGAVNDVVRQFAAAVPP